MNNHQKKRSGRPVIGFFCGNYHSDHPVRMVKILYDLLKDQDVDVRYYLGTESSSFLDAVQIGENRFDYQYASLFGYSRYDDLDAIIISYGTITIYQKEKDVETFLSSLPDVPVILLEDDRPPQGCCSVVIDNRSGIHQIVSHLIEKHHIQRPAFITGPLRNAEARQRYQAFLDTCADYGIEVKKSRIVFGDFSAHIDHQIEDLLSREPDIDAIVSSNDEMAMCADRVLRKHALIPGRDVAVTGFDNAVFAEQLDAPLTTVDQNLKEVMKQAVQLAKEAIEGRKDWDQRVITVDPQVIFRQSCGCHPEQHAKTSDGSHGDMYAVNNAEMQSWSNALLLRELLLQSADASDFLKTLGRQLANFGCPCSYICLLSEAQEIPVDQKTVFPETIRLSMEQIGKEVHAYEEGPVIHAGEGESHVQTDVPTQMFTFLLFYQNRQYGTFMVECTPDEIPYYYGMSLEIGTAIRFQNLMREQKRLYSVLRDKNQILDFAAEHDTLTKLYNRTGVMRKMLNMVHADEEGKFAAIMADLDHLKQINDTFGHLEGDFAIRKSAEFLREGLPEEAVIGRIGGDEFLAFFPLGNQDPVPAIQHVLTKIHQVQEDFEAVSRKPYYVNLSLGSTFFDVSEAFYTQEIIGRTDESLYQAKKKRRASVIREKAS